MSDNLGLKHAASFKTVKIIVMAIIIKGKRREEKERKSTQHLWLAGLKNKLI